MPRVALLFTTYNVPERQAMYRQRLDWWRTHIRFPLFVVDSSGHGFHMDGVPEYVFTQEGGTALSPTDSELVSLRRAERHFRTQFAPFDYVIKITGKYILPSLASNLAQLPCADLILQSEESNQHFQIQSSEVVGFRTATMAATLAALDTKNKTMLESRLFHWAAKSIMVMTL